jgi:phospholipid-binding lipoprotein MlaA
MTLLRLILATVGFLTLGLAASAQAQPPAAPPPLGAATASAPNTGPNADPWEKTNRWFYKFNDALDRAFIRPSATFYRHAAPRPLRAGVHNLVVNLGEPVNFVNHALQLHPTAAAATFGRFALNSTIGIAGLFDVASGAGLPERDTNFGQTLGRYGVGAGPYLFLPVFGPSSVRDATGRVADIFLDPINWLKFRDDTYFFVARAGAGGLDARVEADPILRDINRTATDPYATIRADYIQNADFLSNGGKINVQALPDFGPEPAAPPSTPPK